MCQCYGIFRSRKSEDAYELANGKISKCADAIESDIESIKKIVNQDANAQRQKLTSAYHSSIGTSIVTILISIAALFQQWWQCFGG